MKYLWFVLIFFFLPGVMDFANQVMWKKIFIQLIGAGFIAFFSGLYFRGLKNFFSKYSSSSVVFFIGSLFFWMIPSSVDETTRSYFLNFLMQANILMASFWLGASVFRLSFVTRMAVFIYGLSMLLTFGMIFYSSRGLICAAFTIDMQNEAGLYLLYFFPLLFFIFLFQLGRELKKIAHAGESQ